MTERTAFDARGVANLLLDLADARQISVTNLALQKLLYFAHGNYLISEGRPLVSGYFEAWKHGPVHPLVYSSFKACKDNPITVRAQTYDYLSQTLRPIAQPPEAVAVEQIEKVLLALGRQPVGRLIEISHAKRGPWAEAVNKSGTSGILGLRISDTLTVERFRFMMVPLGAISPFGEPSEDTPLT